MKGTIGPGEQVIRSLAGPALMAVGYSRLGGRDGRATGIAAMALGGLAVAGALGKVSAGSALPGPDGRHERRPLARTGRTRSAGAAPATPEAGDGAWGSDRLRAMHTANALVSLPIGVANLVAPETMRRRMGIPGGDPVSYGLAAGAVPLAFGLAGVLGLRSPVRLSPVLALQTAYKSAFLLGVVLPLALKGRLPDHAVPLSALFGFFVTGNLIALSRAAEA